MVEGHGAALEAAETLLLMTDLFNFWLSGQKAVEFTNATTTQMYDQRAGDWAWPLLEKLGLPYNGSGVASSSVTINKFATNQRLREAGLRVAEHRMATKLDWQADAESFYRGLETQFPYPFIANPADDDCSSAGKKLKPRA